MIPSSHAPEDIYVAYLPTLLYAINVFRCYLQKAKYRKQLEILIRLVLLPRYPCTRARVFSSLRAQAGSQHLHQYCFVFLAKIRHRWLSQTIVKWGC